ncbi:hypothetical protein SKUN_0052 [Spiroplasma kunkelii CR2-3x]|uniref:Uncharacterized protein n=1 Tax=Spiroplasma kunkelii CR2-3x TaxID=273035 RepID=A0A0K2JEY0_SPIKU|nr:hypothetical protein [Spiroplasma kunkelii]ALA96977.1 hypothetical protein SKUN_0052 [Spiroplasma kunkelii CR2-3x]
MVTGTLFQDKVMVYMISKSLWLGQEIKPLYGKTTDGKLQYLKYQQLNYLLVNV